MVCRATPTATASGKARRPKPVGFWTYLANELFSHAVREETAPAAAVALPKELRGDIAVTADLSRILYGATETRRRGRRCGRRVPRSAGV
jgi:hypothetical protein